MIAAYGVPGFGKIQAKLQEFQTAVKHPAVTLAVLDDSVSMASFGGPASAADCASLNTALQRVVASVGPDAILLLGGGDVIPSWDLPNPVADRLIDPDATVLTDNPYGARTPAEYFAPILPVGRICAGSGDSADAFCALIDNLITNHNHRPLRAGYVECTNRAWRDSSTSIASALLGAGRLLVSPDDSVTAINASRLDCKYLYCNLHGFKNDGSWKGFDPVRGYVPAISPASFQPDYVAGTFVYTEACYGLQTLGRRTSGSCALALLAAGAAAVVGSTGLAFGSSQQQPQNLIDADALTRGFFNTMTAGGASVGACLKDARTNFAASGSSALDPFQRKTLLQFQLLGDPSLVI
jgi:hypothetical protein